MSAFLKNLQVKYLAAGVYLPEAPDPGGIGGLRQIHTVWILYVYIPLYLFTQGRWGGEVGEPVIRVKGRQFTIGGVETIWILGHAALLMWTPP
jgi:hypothetical protein